MSGKVTYDIDHLCAVMHDAYEAAAPDAGWETQARSRKPWADVPEPNKRTMRASVRALLTEIAKTDPLDDTRKATP